MIQFFRFLNNKLQRIKHKSSQRKVSISYTHRTLVFIVVGLWIIDGDARTRLRRFRLRTVSEIKWL